VATEDLTERLLTSFDSVNAVLSVKEFFQNSHPAIYIIGDASKIASVEVAPGGKTSVAIKENGILAFTNHYTDTDLLGANERSSRSSFARLKRINYLIGRHTSPFTLDDFIAFSNDRNGGSEGALWTARTLTGKIRTLASWIVYLPANGFPELYVKLANPDEPENTQRITLDSAFWGTKNLPDTLY
jgi:hypothetical protein